MSPSVTERLYFCMDTSTVEWSVGQAITQSCNISILSDIGIAGGSRMNLNPIPSSDLDEHGLWLSM